MLSLRRHNPDAFISLLVDDGTDKNLTGFRGRIKEFVQEYKVVTYPAEFSNMMRSRYLKTGMRSLIKGDFLYLDGDTAIVDQLEFSPFAKLGDVGAVADLHARENDRYRTRHKRFNESLAKLGFSLDLRNLYFNGGVIFAKDSPKAHAFFEEWYRLYLFCNEHKIYTDQFSLNEANHRLGFPIFELPGEWNCQVREAYNHLYRVKTIYPMLCRAKIIHFFGSGIDGKKEPHPLMKKSFFEEIKKAQQIDGEMQKVIDDAESAFEGAPARLDPKVRRPFFFISRQFPNFYRAVNHLREIWKEKN